MSISQETQSKMSFLSGSLLWIGAAVSIAEIASGALLSSLSVASGLTAIIVGHIIGCVLFFFAGFIGAKSKTSAMESVRFSFGKRGSFFFSFLNILQLIGWTAVMIINGSRAAAHALTASSFFSTTSFWTILIGILICIWIWTGITNVGKLNLFAVSALCIVVVILSTVVFSSETPQNFSPAMNFGLALELSIAMPLSWLPLISDYTKNTNKPFSFTLTSTVCYFVASSFMYIIGFWAARFTGSSDIVQILMDANLGITALLIVVLSTVTTTFLDVYSVGESFHNIAQKVSGKRVALLACLAGTLVALFVPMGQYENFLLLIGSVFVPMITILIIDYFILKSTYAEKPINIANMILWLCGFIVYRICLTIDTLVGSTIPAVVITAILCLVVGKIQKRCKDPYSKKGHH